MFQLLAQHPTSKARLGKLQTPHGEIETPCFMPVGTQGTVKTVSPHELKELGASIILGNTYHLFIRPGLKVIEHVGGLHRFISWDRPILTDSGGFQVFSLAKLRKITEDGVHFKSHIDGSALFLGPREAMRIQHVLGSDIMMAFDECPPWPAEEGMMEAAVDRTIRWAGLCKESHEQKTTGPTQGQLLFGIVQGGSFTHLRQKCAEALVALDFPGYAIGGVSVGEPEPEMLHAIEVTEPFLPAHKPRYAMGLGQPDQLVKMVMRGIDMFDCVLPTRVARNGTAYTRFGTTNLKNASNISSLIPIEEGCTCYACRHFSRAYIRHLLKAEEILGLRLISLHNLHFYLTLMKSMRKALQEQRFQAFAQDFLTTYKAREQNHE